MFTITPNKEMEKKICIAETIEDLQKAVDDFAVLPDVEIHACVAMGQPGMLYSAIIFYTQNKF